jgi:hypothetical protein
MDITFSFLISDKPKRKDQLQSTFHTPLACRVSNYVMPTVVSAQIQIDRAFL